jgi:hypothetical protein
MAVANEPVKVYQANAVVRVEDGTTCAQPTGQGKAAISGDFVLLAKEVNPVIRALRAHGIDVTAMHNHMLFEQPHLYFMHFWANDDAVKLAQGLRAALDETNSQRPQIK